MMTTMPIFRGALILVIASWITNCNGQSVKLPSAIESLEKMITLREARGNTIPINADIFKNFVKSKHSTYSVVAMFTALRPGFRCEVCPEAKKEFSILASSYLSSSTTENLFFVIVDYHEASEAFQIMKLQHVPGFYYFPGGRKRMKSDTYTSRRSGYSAKALARWLTDVDGITIKVTVPFDYSKLVVPSLIIFLAAVIAYLKPDLTSQVLGNKILWGVTVMSIVLLMTSGQMWNHIRKPAEAGQNGKNVEYILGSRGGQYVLESYIVMGINFAVSVGFILLNEAQGVKHHILKRAIGFLGIGMVVVCFGFLISIFRLKSRGYPYSFLFA